MTSVPASRHSPVFVDHHSGKSYDDCEAEDGFDLNSGRKQAARSRNPGACMLALWIVSLVITVLALTGILLGSIPSLAVQHHDAAKPPPAEPVPVPVSENHKVYTDDSPTAPSWRPESEYVLPRDWDFNAGPMTREYTWTITDARFNPDGVYRPMMLINNQFPGPLVEANEGDTLVVHIRNRAVNATSIHFHGIYQNGTNAMDGTVGVTQCPIAPGTDYTYRFTVRGQSGTYWYHAHHSAQASDGLLGPFVVHAHNEITELQTLEYASDRVLMVQDHYHNTTAELLMDYLQPRRENEEPVPDSALINGRGLRSCADFPGGWDCDSSALTHPEIRLARGKRHRLRIINVGAIAEFVVQVDEHPFYVTEVDGTDVTHGGGEPFHRLAILPAQRYSIVIEAGQPDGKGTGSGYWFRAGMLTTCFTGENSHLDPDIKAVVRYVDDAEDKETDNDDHDDHHDHRRHGDDDDVDNDGLDEHGSDETTKPSSIHILPTSKPWDDPSIDSICRDLDTTSLVPVVPITPPPADDYILIRASFRIGAWRLSRGFFNETTWHANVTSPSLHRFLDAAAAAGAGTGAPDSSTHDDTAGNSSSSFSSAAAAAAGLGIFQADPTFYNPADEFILQTSSSSNDDSVVAGGSSSSSSSSSPIRTVDIAINNFDDGAHPFHLHGHKFFVLTPSLRGAPPATAAELDAFLHNYTSASHNNNDNNNNDNSTKNGEGNPTTTSSTSSTSSSSSSRTSMLDNPLRRDTVTVAGYEWVVIRVILDNPGLWMLHCHNTWHGEAGMAMQFLVRPEELLRQQQQQQQQQEERRRRRVRVIGTRHGGHGDEDGEAEEEGEVDKVNEEEGGGGGGGGGGATGGFGMVGSVEREMCTRPGVTNGVRPDDSIWFGQF